MTDAASILHDLIGRVRDEGSSVVHGLSQADATYQPAPGTNTICWLLWHSGRIADSQIHDALGGDQLWARWADRLRLPLSTDRLGAGATGYGQSPEDVVYVVAPVDKLFGYLSEVCDDMDRLVDGLGEADLDRVIDRSWNPPVTVAVRIVSILADCLQHIGQAAFLRGIAERTHAE